MKFYKIRKTVFAAVLFSAVMLIAGASSCSSSNKGDADSGMSKADSLEMLKKKIVPGFKLSTLGDANDFTFKIAEIKGVCAPDKKVLYLVLDSVCYETNVVSVNDSAWTNVTSMDTATVKAKFGPDAAITIAPGKSFDNVMSEITAQFDSEVKEATAAATSAAKKVVAKEGTWVTPDGYVEEGDDNYSLGTVVPTNLQKGTFKYQIKKYYPYGRGMKYSGSYYRNVTVSKKDGKFTAR